MREQTTFSSSRSLTHGCILSIMRNAKVIDRWKMNEERRHKFIDRVESLSKDEMHARPAKDEYNALELLEHMALAEIFYIPLLKRHDPKILYATEPKPRFVFPFVLRQLSSAKGMPTVGAMKPKGTPTFEHAAEKWHDVRREISRMIVEVPENGSFLKHPLLGRLGPFHFFDLLDAHFDYHEKRFPVKNR